MFIVATNSSMSTTKPRYDVVILGAGHNGLVAASYLTRAGLSVLLLEKNDYIGGATTNAREIVKVRAGLALLHRNQARRLTC